MNSNSASKGNRSILESVAQPPQDRPAAAAAAAAERIRNSARRRDGQNAAHGANRCRGEDVTTRRSGSSIAPACSWRRMRGGPDAEPGRYRGTASADGATGTGYKRGPYFSPRWHQERPQGSYRGGQNARPPTGGPAPAAS